MPPAGSRIGRTAGRLEDYADLRAMGLTQAAAAERMGVTSRTVSRYEGRLRATRDAAVSLEAPASAGSDLQRGPRRGCGTYLAFRLHQLLGEEPCPECLTGETLRRGERSPRPAADVRSIRKPAGWPGERVERAA